MATILDISQAQALGLIVEVKLNDQITEPIAVAQRAVNSAVTEMVSSVSLAEAAFRGLDTQVQANGRSIERLMSAAAGGAGTITQAASSWDRLAQRYDQSSKAGAQLEVAMRNIDKATASYNATLRTTDSTTQETLEINRQAAVVFGTLNTQLATAADRYVRLKAAQSGGPGNYTTPVPPTLNQQQQQNNLPLFSYAGQTPQSGQLPLFPNLAQSFPPGATDPRLLQLYGAQEAALRNIAAQQQAAALVRNTAVAGTTIAGFLGSGGGPAALPPTNFYSGSGQFPNQQTANVPAYNARQDDLQLAFASAEKLAEGYDKGAASAARLASEISNITSVMSILGEDKAGRALNEALDEYADSAKEAEKAIEDASTAQDRFLDQSRRIGTVAAAVSAQADQRLGAPTTVTGLSQDEKAQVNDVVNRFTEKQNQANQAGLSPSVANAVQSEALKQFQVQLDGVTQAIERTRAATSAMLDGLAEKFIPGITAAKQFAAVQQQIQELFDAGRVTQQEAADITTVQAGAYDKLAESARVAAQATAQQAENARLGGIAGTRPELLPAQSATRQADVEAAFGAQQQQIDQINVLATAEQKYADQHKTLQALRTQGVVGAQEAAVAEARYAAEVEGVRKKVDDQAKAYQALQTAENQANAIRDTGRQLTAAESAELEKAQKTFQASVVEVDKTKGSIAGATIAVGGMTREFVVLGHEILQGNISRLGGSLIVVTEYFQAFREELFKVAGQLFTTVGGLASLGGVAVVGALAYLGISAQKAQDRLADLSNQGRATRADFEQNATAIDQAFRELTRGQDALNGAQKDRVLTASKKDPIEASSEDVLPALASIGHSAEFNDNVEALKQLTTLANNLAQVYQITLPEAAKRFIVEGLQNPGAAAKKLADEDFPGMNAVLARSIDLQAKAGDSAGAAARIFDIQSKAVQGATDKHTSLGKAVQDLQRSFNETDGSGKSFGESLGTAVTEAAATAVRGLTSLIQAIKELRDLVDELRGTDKPPNVGGFIGNLSNWILGLVGASGSEQLSLGPNATSLVPRGLAGTRTGQESVDAQVTRILNAVPSLGLTGGQVLTDQTPGVPAGSIGHGVMQVVPSTAQGRGLPSGFIDQNAAQNIVAGVQLLNDLLTSGGSVRSAVKAYGGFSDDNTAGLNAKLARLQNANTGSLPSDVYQGIVLASQGYNNPDLTRLALQTAVVESRGNQFRVPGAPSNNSATAGRFGDVIGTQPQQDFASLLTNSATGGDLNKALSAATAVHEAVPSETRTAIEAQIAGFTKWRDELGKDTAQGRLFQDAINDLNSKLYETRTPLESLDKTTRDRIAVLQGGTGAEKAYAEALVQAQDAARRSSETGLSSTQIAKVYADTQKELNLTFKSSVDDINKKTAADEAANNADLKAIANLDSYAAAQQHNANLALAQIEALKTARVNTDDYASQVNVLVDALDHKTQVENASKLTATLFDQKQQIELTKEEISVVGLSADKQAVYLAVFKEVQALKRANISLDTEAAQAAIANAAEIAKLTEQENFYKQSLSDVAGALTGAFDQLGQAIANAFVSGQGAAVNFHNVVKGILGSLATKAIELGVINPITNALGLGPTRGTLYGALEAGSQTRSLSDPSQIAAIRAASGVDQNQISLQDNTAALITLTNAINAGGIGGRNGGTDLLNPDGSLVVPPRPPQAPPGLQESQILSPIEQDAYRVQGHYGSFLPVGSPEEEATQRQLGIRASDTARFLQIDPGNQQSDAWKYPWPDSPQSRRIENPDFVQKQAEADANIISAAISERLKEVPLDQLHTGQAYLDRYGTPTPPDVMALPPSEIDRNGLVNGSSASGATMQPTGPTNIDRNGLTQAFDEQKQNLEDNTDALQKLNSTLNAASESNVSAPGITPGAVGSIFSGGGGTGVSGTSAFSLSQQLNGGSTGNLVFLPGPSGSGFVDQGNFDTSGSSSSQVIFLNGTNAGPQSVVDTNTGIQTEPLAAPGQGDFGTVVVNASSPSSSPIIIPSQGGSGGFTDIAQTIGAVSNVERSVSGGGFSSNSLLSAASLVDKLGGFGGSSGGGSLLSFLNPFGGGSGGGGGLLNNIFGNVFSSNGGIGSLFNGTGIFGASGPIADFLQTPLFGSVSASATNTALGGLTGFGPETAGQFAAAGGSVPTTIGQALGGFGLGFGAGSLVGGGVQNLLGKTGPGPTIGAGVGAGIGAIFGPVGSLVGGLLGGAVGGLIGPKPASPFSSTYVGVGDNGLLSLGGSVSQQLNTDADRAAANVAIQQTNAVLRNNGLGITGIEGVNGAGRALNVNQGDITSFQIGQNSPKGPNDPSKFADFAAAFSAFRFAPTTPGVSSAFFQNKSFASAEELDKVTQSVNTFVAALQSSDAAGRISDFLAKTSQMANADIPQRLSDITTFVTQTVPQLTNTGSLAQQIQQLNTQYRAAITMAQQLGYAEQQLTESRDAAIAKANANAAFTLQQGEVGNRLSFSTAYDAVNAPQGAANASAVLRAQQATQLYGFDNVTAPQARKQLSDSLIATYGDAFQNSAAFANQMAVLEQSLGEQRLAIARNFGDQIENADKAAVTAAFNFQQGNYGLTVRYGTASNTLYAGDPGSVEQINAQKGTALYNFDNVTAATERKQLTDSLVSAYGDAITTTAGYGAELALLEKTLGVERLAIAKQFDDQIANENKQAQGSVYSLSQSLASYARNLGNSVLSPQQQYANAQKAFEQQSSLAQGGDFTAIQNLTGYADTFISTSRALFGSGQQYFQNVTAVLDVLNNLATTPQETLTSYAFQQIQKQLMLDQTDQLLTGLGQLGDILNSILNQMQVSPLKPPRLA